MKKKVYETKKSYICTKDPPLSAKCSTSNMKNYQPGLTRHNEFNSNIKTFKKQIKSLLF